MGVDMSDPRLRLPKGEKRATTKRRKDRGEALIKKLARAACVARDGYCVVRSMYPGSQYLRTEALWCEGDSQWCHMHSRRRSQTRNQAPEVRHDTAHSFMACAKHHNQYDGKQRPKLFVTALTRQGANGPLKFRLGKS